MPPKLLTVAEAAAMSRVSLRTMRTLLSEHRGPTTTRIGGSVRIRSDHFDEWLERSAQRTPERVP